MKSPILYFLLLVLRIPLNLVPDASHKQGKFPKTLLGKSLKFISSRGGGIIVFKLSFVLLPAEINLIAKEQSCKKNAFKTNGIRHIKMILVLPTKVITLYI